MLLTNVKATAEEVAYKNSIFVQERGRLQGVQTVIFIITVTISLNFFDPKVWIFPLFKPKLENLPILSVKKFTIAKNSNFIFGKNNVRRTREDFIIFAIAITFVP